MTENDYQPVSCDMHSQLELAIMHRSSLLLRWHSNGSTITRLTLPADIFTRDRQEFLLVKTDDGETLEIRLDKILSMSVT